MPTADLLEVEKSSGTFVNDISRDLYPGNASRKKRSSFASRTMPGPGGRCFHPMGHGCGGMEHGGSLEILSPMASGCSLP